MDSPHVRNGVASVERLPIDSFTGPSGMLMRMITSNVEMAHFDKLFLQPDEEEIKSIIEID